MPRKRQRIVFCDCFDCVDRPEQPELSKEQLDAATAVARQEPPPKALIVCASGFLAHSAADGPNLEACSLPHLNRAVREGCLGMLAARAPPSLAGARLEGRGGELHGLPANTIACRISA